MGGERLHVAAQFGTTGVSVMAEFVCFDCEQTFPAEMRSVDGMRLCKPCKAARQRRRRYENPKLLDEAQLAAQREAGARFRAKPENKKKRTDADRHRRAGISTTQYEEMLARQGGVCAICGDPPPEDRCFHVDHDHRCCAGRNSCGKCVRGLLCFECNRGLGVFSDDADRLISAAAYLMGHTPDPQQCGTNGRAVSGRG